MDSIVIQEVFQVEKEAQDIVELARKESREMVHQKQVELERESHEKLALARKQRDQEIEKATLEAKRTREQYEEDLENKSKSDEQLLACADDIAKKMVPIILHSDVGDAL